jgi:hypothetical protein
LREALRVESYLNKVAATVTRFCDQFAHATGLVAEDLRVRSKVMRDAGVLPKSARGRGATPATTAEAVKIMLAALGGGLQTRTPDLVAAIWQLKYSHADQITRAVGPDGVERTAYLQTRLGIELEQGLTSRNFGSVICFAIDECRSHGGRTAILGNVEGLHVWQAGDCAMIETKSGARYWYHQPIHAQSPASLIAPARVRIMASIPAVALAIAADLTLHSSELQTNEPELALAETKDAPRTMARGASDSVSQQDGNPVDPSVPPESATSGRSGQERELGHRSTVITSQGDPHGSIVSFRAAAIA